MNKTTKPKNVYKKYYYYNDRVELSFKYLIHKRKVEKLAHERAKLVVDENSKAFLHVFWGCKKNILKEKYNIDWRTPVELNPHIKFN